jgi:TatD DNase family protein
MDEQRLIFAEMLALLRGQPMVVSIHSAGAEKVAVDMLERSWPSGVILHWFQGAPELVRRAVDLGAYFSVNAAMSDQQLARLPKERVLCETDFPSRRVKATIPGDVATAEQRLAAIWDVAPEEVRLTCWWNLRRIAETSGAIDRMPEPLANKLLLL